MKKEYLYGIIGLLGGILVAILFARSTVNSNNVGMMRMIGMRGISQNMMQNEQAIDAHFIEQMIPHHEDAITMANLALERSNNVDVRKLASDIITSQGKEIDQMKAWYNQWFEKELPTGDQVMQHHGMASGSGMHMGIMGDESDTTRLTQAEDFDKAFVEEMIPHHQMAVMMANMLKNGTTRAVMKKLADDIITSQTQEIDMMRLWLREGSI